jgi:prepilin-type N-terminal cleavage/methylation domain-containing protein
MENNIMFLPGLLGGKKKKGFTLIELLIVIAIILILIAIALPNFLEAQIRARVTKARGEIRSYQTVFESYNQDFKIYPRGCITGHSVGCTHNWGFCGANLTTPIKYIQRNNDDLFAVHYSVLGSSGIVPEGHPWVKYRTTRRMVWNAMNPNEPPKSLVPKDKMAPHWKLYDTANPAVWKPKQYLIASLGPDHIEDVVPQYAFGSSTKPKYYLNDEFYSPTNGTTSSGDIFFAGP